MDLLCNFLPFRVKEPVHFPGIYNPILILVNLIEFYFS